MRVNPPGQVEIPIAGNIHGAAGSAQVHEGHALWIFYEVVGDILHCQFRNIDNGELELTFCDPVDYLLDAGFLGCHHIHHLAPAIGAFRYLKYIDGRLLDLCIQQVLDLPAHGGTHFFGLYRGCLHQVQTVIFGAQHKTALAAFQSQVFHDFNQSDTRIFFRLHRDRFTMQKIRRIVSLPHMGERQLLGVDYDADTSRRLCFLLEKLHYRPFYYQFQLSPRTVPFLRGTRIHVLRAGAHKT